MKSALKNIAVALTMGMVLFGTAACGESGTGTYASETKTTTSAEKRLDGLTDEDVEYVYDEEEPEPAPADVEKIRKALDADAEGFYIVVLNADAGEVVYCQLLPDGSVTSLLEKDMNTCVDAYEKVAK